MQGADIAQLCTNVHEIMRPYAGIIRIRFLGMISATVSRSTPANISAKICYLSESFAATYINSIISSPYFLYGLLYADKIHPKLIMRVMIYGDASFRLHRSLFFLDIK